MRRDRLTELYEEEAEAAESKVCGGLSGRGVQGGSSESRNIAPILYVSSCHVALVEGVGHTL